MLNAAIVGLGRWGKNTVKAVQGASDRVRFVRGVARDPEAAREFAGQHGLQLCADLADVLADSRVQAVVLVTPHALHAEQIIAVAGAGKHVFCEKPLALTRADAERAIAACRRSDVALGVGQDKRFWPSLRELKRVVASGELGEVLHVEGHFSNESSRLFRSPWRELPEDAPGASLTATGVHVLDAFVNLVGPARRAQALRVSRKPDPDPTDTVSVLYEFANRVSGVLGAVRATPSYWRVHVFGTRGSAEALDETSLVLRMTGKEPQRLSFDPVNALRVQLEAFADAVEGRAPYPIPPEQMLATVAALEATIRSVTSNSWELVE